MPVVGGQIGCHTGSMLVSIEAEDDIVAKPVTNAVVPRASAL